MIRNRKNRCCSRIAIIAAVGLAVGVQGVQAGDLTFTSWAGPYMRSQMLGFVRPYEAQTAKEVNVEYYDGGIDEIRDQVASANVKWDVVDLTQADSLRACNEGLLEDLSGISLPPGADGTLATDDFIDGALNKCGVGIIVWATAFAYQNGAFGDKEPAVINDFFDTKNFPGPRAIRDDPTVIMEWALMADGVARDDVYPTLETTEGVKRALAKMDSIKPGIVIWSGGLEPARLLNSGEAVMSSVFASTSAQLAEAEGANFTVNWDGRVIEQDLFGIPKGSPNKAEAIEFIKFASSAQSLADMVSYLPAGPTRRSSMSLISDDVKNRLPIGEARAGTASITSDAEWWAANYDRLNEAFRTWVDAAVQQGAGGKVR